ncbi:hypothetical protein ILYODFUR_021561, partial [Ilyodon furcidens]
VIDVSDGFLALMDDNGETREDLKVPDGDLGKEIEKKYSGGEQFMVSVLKAVDEEHLKFWKLDPVSFSCTSYSGQLGILLSPLRCPSKAFTAPLCSTYQEEIWPFASAGKE